MFLNASLQIYAIEKLFNGADTLSQGHQNSGCCDSIYINKAAQNAENSYRCWYCQKFGSCNDCWSKIRQEEKYKDTSCKVCSIYPKSGKGLIFLTAILYTYFGKHTAHLFSSGWFSKTVFWTLSPVSSQVISPPDFELKKCRLQPNYKPSRRSGDILLPPFCLLFLFS